MKMQGNRGNLFIRKEKQKEQNEIDITRPRQLRTLINNKKICNKKLYEKYKKEEISVTIKRNK